MLQTPQTPAFGAAVRLARAERAPPPGMARRGASAAEPQCAGWGTDLGDKGLRVASIFIILAGSMLGVFLPMLLARTSPNWRFAKLVFFVCKYFGSGVILATAFMHLLSPAVDALTDACLRHILPDYDWGHAICLMTIMAMFYIELMAARFNFDFGHAHAGGPAASPKDTGSPSASGHSHGRSHGHGHGHGHSHGHGHGHSRGLHNALTSAMAERRLSHNSALSGLDIRGSGSSSSPHVNDVEAVAAFSSSSGGLTLADSASNVTTVSAKASPPGGTLLSAAVTQRPKATPPATTAALPPAQTQPQPQQPFHGGLPSHLNYPPGNEDHLAHERDHVDGDSHATYGSQIVSLLILEFGVVFHSLFIGLSLAGSDNLHVLLIVIAFHQFFEGLGLGSRLAVARWPSDWKAWTGYLMAVGYGVTTPIGIAVGLGVNAGLNARPDVAQLVNGIFDAVSSGILVYTALVELLAHEFMFNPEMRDAKLRVQMLAFACVAVGVAIMALLAKWA